MHVQALNIIYVFAKKTEHILGDPRGHRGSVHTRGTPCAQRSLIFIFKMCVLRIWEIQKNTKYYISSKHLVLITIQCMKLIELGKSACKHLLKVVCCFINKLYIWTSLICRSVNWPQTVAISNSHLVWKK